MRWSSQTWLPWLYVTTFAPALSSSTTLISSPNSLLLILLRFLLIGCCRLVIEGRHGILLPEYRRVKGLTEEMWAQLEVRGGQNRNWGWVCREGGDVDGLVWDVRNRS
ncbi:hypothetical protein AMTR_s00006p00258760 [Amborella trichopoda]|uniref:Uncharacterized protein n=1 Tax=Amborella trichopoda TaxID=13333 RepID=W1P7F8_AMBTC|nr:hypothetical protein AMTR_s00006p00258760 [Amborella trichopoda]